MRSGRRFADRRRAWWRCLATTRDRRSTSTATATATATADDRRRQAGRHHRRRAAQAVELAAAAGPAQGHAGEASRQEGRHRPAGPDEAALDPRWPLDLQRPPAEDTGPRHRSRRRAALVGAGVANAHGPGSQRFLDVPGRAGRWRARSSSTSRRPPFSEKVYVQVGETVKIGQPLAAQQSNLISAQLGRRPPHIRPPTSCAWRSYSAVSERGCRRRRRRPTPRRSSRPPPHSSARENVVDLTAILAAEQQTLSGEQGELCTDVQSDYNAKCNNWSRQHRVRSRCPPE